MRSIYLWLALGALSLTAFSCEPPRNPDRETSHVLDREGFTEYRQDTQIVFSHQGKDEIMRVPVWLGREDIPNILDLIQQYPSGETDSTRTYEEELTGEGNPELITERVWFEDEVYKTYWSVTSEGKVIWEDSSMTDIDYFSQVIWEDPDAFMSMYPWTGLYYSQFNFPAFETELLPFATNEITLGLEMMRRELDPNDKMARERVSRDLNKMLAEFDGKALVVAGTVDAEVYIWDKKRQEFVLLYSP